MKIGAALSFLLHALFFFLILHTAPLREVAGHRGSLSLSLISSGQRETKGEGGASAACMDTQEKEGQDSSPVEDTSEQKTGEKQQAEETSPSLLPEEHISLQKRLKNAEKKEKPSLKAQHRSSVKSAPSKKADLSKEKAGKKAVTGKAPAGEKKDSFREGTGAAPGEAGAGAGGMADVAFGSENGPSFLRFVRPEYPLRARRMGISGVVRLLVTLDAHGRAVHVEVMGYPPSILAEAAAESIRRSSFRPYRRGEKSLSCRTVIPVRFVLE